MAQDTIDGKKTGILFFDVLNGYVHGAEGAGKARKMAMLENAVRLMKAGREAGIPIFFANGNNRADDATSALLLTDVTMSDRPWPGGVVAKGHSRVVAGESSAEVVPELDPRPDDYHIPKYRWSAFFQTYLDLALRARGIDTIIVSGGSTDVGVAATVFAGRDLDYHLILARDACATSHDQRAHDVLMDLVFPRMGRVRTTDQVVRMIGEAGER
ncbi:MAG TPA: cysteine hydrolase [Candidatus Binatia bacterium]